MTGDVDSTENGDSAHAPVSQTVGEMLIAARERRALSADDVARQLRLAPRQVEALEANRFDALPGNTFVRGFLRNYAKAVQMDPAVFLDAYERSLPRPPLVTIAGPTEHIDYTKTGTPRWLWYLLGLVVVLVGAPLLIYALLGDADGGRTSAPAPVATPAPAAAPSPPAVQEMPLALPPAESVTVAPPVDGAAAVVPSPGAPAGETTAAAPAPVPAPASTAKPARLVLKFQSDAWVEIRDKTGNKVFAQMGRRGTEEHIPGDPPFDLVVGNAPEVQVFYNGKSIPLAPHTKVSVARFTLE